MRQIWRGDHERTEKTEHRIKLKSFFFPFNKNKNARFPKARKKEEERRESTRGQGCGPKQAAEIPLPTDMPFNGFTCRTPWLGVERNG